MTNKQIPAKLESTFLLIQQIMNMHWHLHLLRQAIMCNHMEFIFAFQLCTRLYTDGQVLQPAQLIPKCSTRDPVLLNVIFPAFKQLYWTRVSKISRFHSGHQSSSVRWQCRRQEVNIIDLRTEFNHCFTIQWSVCLFDPCLSLRNF